MAFCSQCGQELPPDYMFCGGCGRATAIASYSTRNLSAESIGAAVAAAAAAKPIEKEFLREKTVVVSNSRFIVGGHTHAMSGITSVKSSRRDPNRAAPLFFVLTGFALGAIGMTGENLVVLGVGMAITIVALLWLLSQRPVYCIVLHSASGETQALQDHDERFILSVVQALNSAIVYRS